MARVIVKFFASVREALGTKKIEIEADTIQGVLKSLMEKFGNTFTETVMDPNGELKQFYSCMVNGKRIELLDGHDTILNDGDSVAIFPPVGGG